MCLCVRALASFLECSVYQKDRDRGGGLRDRDSERASERVRARVCATDFFGCLPKSVPHHLQPCLCVCVCVFAGAHVFVGALWCGWPCERVCVQHATFATIACAHRHNLTHFLHTPGGILMRAATACFSSAAQPQTREPHERSRGAVAQARDTAASGVPCSAHTIGVAVAQAGILPPSRETQNIACAESRGAQHSAARRGARYGLRARGNDARRWHAIPCPGAQHRRPSTDTQRENSGREQVTRRALPPIVPAACACGPPHSRRGHPVYAPAKKVFSFPRQHEKRHTFVLCRTSSPSLLSQKTHLSRTY